MMKQRRFVLFALHTLGMAVLAIAGDSGTSTHRPSKGVKTGEAFPL
jgi:hypothetical protein